MGRKPKIIKEVIVNETDEVVDIVENVNVPD